MEEYKSAENRSRVWRIMAIIAVVFAFVLIIIINLTSKPDHSEQVWDIATTMGDPKSGNYYIMYTDLMCPYCDVFSREAMNHWEEFEQYLSDNDILFEIRLTDYLYEGNGIQASRDAAEGAYCATKENKFWDYYHEALSSLWVDYHSKGIGDSKNSTPIKDMPDNYWTKIGQKVGLGDDFLNCVNNHETVAQIENNTEKALRVSDGMPYFKFNRFTTSGFDNNWGWDYVVRYLDAGLSKS